MIKTSTVIASLIAAIVVPSMLWAQTDAKPVAADNEILVIAHRMRRLKLDYALNACVLRQCTIRTSSGDQRIDRIMCAILSACVNEGHTTPKAAKSCMSDRIATFKDTAISPPSEQEERQWQSTPTVPPVSFSPRDTLATIETPQSGIRMDDPVLRPAQPTAMGEPDTELESDANAPIIVTGNINPIVAGEWEFTQQGTTTSLSRASFSGVRSWRLCITEAALKPTLEAMLKESLVIDDAPSHCYKWNISITDNYIKGDQRCFIAYGLRMTGEIKGKISKYEITITRHTRLFKISGRSSVDDDLETTYEINGSRIGTCIADRYRH